MNHRSVLVSRPRVSRGVFSGSAAMVLCGTMASTALGSTPGLADDPHAPILAQQIEQLQQRIAELEAGNANDRWMNEARAASIRAMVQDVLADADTRASLLQSGVSAGYDGGFFIGSSDGNFRLKIAGRTQVRYVYNYQDDAAGDGDRHRSGFELRRTRLVFSGHIIDPSWGYQIQGDFNRTGGGLTLLEAFVDKKLDNGVVIRAGQFRPRFLFEDSTSSGRQLAAERSLVNSAFAQGFTQGVEVRGKAGDQVRWSAAILDGIPTSTGNQGGGANVGWSTRQTEFSTLGRVEVLLAGDWKQFGEFTSWSGEEFAFLIGGGAAWQKDEYGTAAAETEAFRWTLDATAKFGGANAFVAFIGNHEDTNGGGGSVDQYGLIVQGGFFFVPDEWEAFARYEWGDADMAGVEDLNVITVGVNRYWARHNLKWTTDVGVGLDEVSGAWASSSAGWRTDLPDEDGQMVIRSQLQLAF